MNLEAKENELNYQTKRDYYDFLYEKSFFNNTKSYTDNLLNETKNKLKRWIKQQSLITEIQSEPNRLINTNISQEKDFFNEKQNSGIETADFDFYKELFKDEIETAEETIEIAI